MGFRQCCRAAQSAVRKAKETWVTSVVREAENSHSSGKSCWDSIQKLKALHAGRESIHQSSVYLEDGSLTDSPVSLANRWLRHFQGVLNVASVFDAAVVEEIPDRPVATDMDNAPSPEELEQALLKMKLGKAGGKSGVLPDILRHGGAALHGSLLRLMEKVWAVGQVPAEWRDAIVVPVPKKDDLRSCDNWRGISLLDVAGKVFARVIQDRLQAFAEDVLPDSQCGFRQERGCVDMIFVARQLIEKTIEHESELYILFVDLKKAYDSIPRVALWRVLEKLFVPPKML